MNTLKELLIQFDACSPAIEWAGDKTIEEVVKECHRGDWLLYLAKKIELPERKIIACAGHCVNTVRNLMKDERSIKLLDMCMNFEDESISFEELEVARAADANAARAAVARAADAYAARAAACVDARAALADARAADANATDANAARAADAYAARAAACVDARAALADARAADANATDANAARAADAYADAAALADYAAAHKENQLQTAKIVRERIGQDIINKVNQLLNN